MTRFGEILPPSKICISLWPFLKGLFSIWQPDQNTLAKLFCFWENLQCCKLANIEQINLTIWSHCHPSTAELWLKNFTILKVPKSTNIFTLDQSKVGFIELFIARLVKILVRFVKFFANSQMDWKNETYNWIKPTLTNPDTTLLLSEKCLK